MPTAELPPLDDGGGDGEEEEDGFGGLTIVRTAISGAPLDASAACRADGEAKIPEASIVDLDVATAMFATEISAVIVTDEAVTVRETDAMSTFAAVAIPRLMAERSVASYSDTSPEAMKVVVTKPLGPFEGRTGWGAGGGS